MRTMLDGCSEHVAQVRNEIGKVDLVDCVHQSVKFELRNKCAQKGYISGIRSL